VLSSLSQVKLETDIFPVTCSVDFPSSLLGTTGLHLSYYEEYLRHTIDDNHDGTTLGGSNGPLSSRP